MKTQVDRQRNEDHMTSLKKSNDFLLQQNQEMTTELNEFKQLMHVEGTREPGMNSSEKLKKMAASLKQQNEILRDENAELGRILQAFRDGNYNTVEGAKMLAEE